MINPQKALFEIRAGDFSPVQIVPGVIRVMRYRPTSTQNQRLPGEPPARVSRETAPESAGTGKGATGAPGTAAAPAARGRVKACHAVTCPENSTENISGRGFTKRPRRAVPREYPDVF
jgi:hypothetical protein